MLHLLLKWMTTIEREDCRVSEGRRRQHIAGKINILALATNGKQQARWRLASHIRARRLEKKKKKKKKRKGTRTRTDPCLSTLFTCAVKHIFK